MGRSRTSAKAEVLFCRTFGSRRTVRFAGIFVAAVLVATAVPGVDAVSSERLTSARRAAQWLVDGQQSNGAFFSSTQRVDQTAETLVAVVAGGITGSPVTSALDYIRANGQAGASRAAFTGRIVAGIVAGGGDPKSFGGVDYVSILNSQYDQATGAYEPGDFDFFSNVIAATGAVAANGTLPPQAVAYLRSNECPGGGFSFSKACAFGPDLDTTALTVNVLVAAGLAADPTVIDARTFALTRQGDDGGFAFDGFSSTSGDSTGLGLALIAALGEEAQVHPWRQPDGDDPVTALLGLQDAAGAFKFSSAEAAGNALTTVNAIPGMAGRPLPIRGTPTAPPPSDEPTPDPEPAPGDATAPDTAIGSGDLVRTRDRTPTFQFASDKVGVRFECAVDADTDVPCSSPFTVQRLGFGEHTFSVRAIDAAGNADGSPASDVFKVVKKRKR
jgi:hypothetical protein